MSTPYPITTQAQVRASFWESYPELVCRLNRRGNPLPQNEQPTTTRCAFVDHVDNLARDGQISEALAQRVTL